MIPVEHMKEQIKHLENNASESQGYASKCFSRGEQAIIEAERLLLLAEQFKAAIAILENNRSNGE